MAKFATFLNFGSVLPPGASTKNILPGPPLGQWVSLLSLFLSVGSFLSGGCPPHSHVHSTLSYPWVSSRLLACLSSCPHLLPLCSPVLSRLPALLEGQASGPRFPCPASAPAAGPDFPTMEVLPVSTGEALSPSPG